MKNDNGVPIPSELPSKPEIVSTILAETEREIGALYKKLLVNKPEVLEEYLEEDLPRALERENKFAQAILDAYEVWSLEENVVVLWDIDDNIGKWTKIDDQDTWW